MIKKRFLLPAAAGALALTIGLAGIWFNQRLPALADFGVPGMDPEAQLMAWAALFPEKGVAALTFRTVLQWMAIAVFCTLGAVVLALYRYKPQKELGYFLLYLTVLTLWALVIILAPVGSSGWSVFFRRGFFTVTVLAGILYKCRTGCQWAMLPACYGSKSSVHEHFQRWNKAGIMAEIFRILLAEYGEKVGVDAQWQAMDGTLLQAPTRSQKISD